MNAQQTQLYVRCLTVLVLWMLVQQPLLARQFKPALPGYIYRFPADHASHNDYKTEWWYYTGHLATDDGRRFGYELTFFRSALDVVDGVKKSPWAVDNIYLAHFAVSDLAADKFFYDARLSRPALDFAGASAERLHVWNQNWLADMPGAQRDSAQTISAASGGYALNLALTSQKPPAIHGTNGVSQKASCYGCASHYYSFTRLQTDGEITVDGKKFKVHGISWMDHEFGSNQLQADEAGWDWFSVQLDDNTELMLYVMRRKDGSIDSNSSGTSISATGATQYLNAKTYRIKPKGSWRSPTTGATYPMGWIVEIPDRDMVLTISPEMLNQELGKKRSFDVSYWEGACKVTGTRAGKPVSGQAYVEMTGYAGAFNAGI